MNPRPTQVGRGRRRGGSDSMGRGANVNVHVTHFIFRRAPGGGRCQKPILTDEK